MAGRRNAQCRRKGSVLGAFREGGLNWENIPVTEWAISPSFIYPKWKSDGSALLFGDQVEK